MIWLKSIGELASRRKKIDEWGHSIGEWGNGKTGAKGSGLSERWAFRKKGAFKRKRRLQKKKVGLQEMILQAALV